MSTYGRKNSEQGVRFEMLMIKLKVKLGLLFFSKVEIKKEIEFVSCSMEDALTKWSFFLKI